MKLVTSILVVVAIASLIACGGGVKTAPPAQSQPLDPQGNWIFTFTNPSDTFSLAGQLFELSPPVVTSNQLAPVGSVTPCLGEFTFAGQASGTDAITFTADQTNVSGTPVSLSLTGTIAADQAHMSGNWTVSKGGTCLGAGNGGTWTAQVLAPLTGTWAGTLSNSTSNLSVTANLTENVDQTSPNMGQLTGTVSLLGSPCFPSSDTLNVTAAASGHGGEGFFVNTDADVNGVSFGSGGNVTADAVTVSFNALTIHGGVCDGQSFSGTLTH